MRINNYLIILLLLLLFNISNYAQQPIKKVTKENVKESLVDKYCTIAKLYGYIRYFYPGDDAAAIDWDKFAYYAARRIGESKADNFKNELKSLFLTFAPDIHIEKTGIKYANPANTVAIQQKDRAVYWQHLGDGKGCIGYPYKSMRVNRAARVLPESPNDYGNISKNLSIEELRGKEIRLTGKILADPLFNGIPSFIILIKEKGKDTKRISSEGQLFSADKWLTQSVVTVIPDSVERIAIQVQSITLTGAIKFDDLLWEVKEENEWRVKELIDFNKINDEDLKKVWKIGAPNQDIQLEGDKDNQWIGFNRTKGQIKEVPPLFERSPAGNGWITKTIGMNLSVTFPLVLYTSNVVIPGKGAYQQMTQEIADIPSGNYNAEHVYVRIANVIILWNKLQHFHPDNPMTSAQWESELRKAIRQSLLDKTLADHRKTLTKMIAPIHDSHMTIFYFTITPQEFYLPLQWEMIENKLVVTDVLDSTLTIHPGDIITHVNGVSAEKFWSNVNEEVAGATASRKKIKAIDKSLQGDKTTLVTLKPANSNKELVLQRTLTEIQFNNLLIKKRKFNQYVQVEAGVYYVNLSQITWSDLQAHLPELVAAKGIIFDLRGYPSWQTLNIVSHFIHKPIFRMSYGLPMIIYPDREKMDISYTAGDTILPAEPYIPAKKVFLTNGKAVSYSEDFLNLISYYHLADIVGEPTAGTTGNVNMCYLFGGLSTPWTGMHVLRQDGVAYNGKGILPGYYARKTIEGIKKGKDEYVEYALKHIFKIERRMIK